MEIADIVQPGDKVEMRVVQQIEAAAKDGNEAKVYKSQVLDIQDERLLLAMPTESGRLVLLPLGIRFEIVFYSMGGLYRAIGLIKERYKKDNIYMLEVEFKTQLEKFQRREFFRYPCSLDLRYLVLTEEEDALETREGVFRTIYRSGDTQRIKTGVLLDLSGGGTRFRTPQRLAESDSLLLELRLKNEQHDNQFYIVAHIVECRAVENGREELYEVRVKFLMKDDKIREEIIQYIFEEERRRRQKEIR